MIMILISCSPIFILESKICNTPPVPQFSTELQCTLYTYILNFGIELRYGLYKKQVKVLGDK